MGLRDALTSRPAERPLHAVCRPSLALREPDDGHTAVGDPAVSISLTAAPERTASSRLG
jgi:hypothetical protein